METVKRRFCVQWHWDFSNPYFTIGVVRRAPAISMRILGKWSVGMNITGKFEDQLLQESLPPSATPRLSNYLVLYVKYSSGRNPVKRYFFGP
jgi:hypothetical protein